MYGHVRKEINIHTYMCITHTHKYTKKIYQHKPNLFLHKPFFTKNEKGEEKEEEKNNYLYLLGIMNTLTCLSITGQTMNNKQHKFSTAQNKSF